MVGNGTNIRIHCIDKQRATQISRFDSKNYKPQQLIIGCRFGGTLYIIHISNKKHYKFISVRNEALQSFCYFSVNSIDFLDNRVYNINRILDIRELEVSLVARVKFQTLTEQMFYTLLCLKDECYGMDILDRVPAMTNQRVNVGSGTLYTLLEQFLDAEMIQETKVEGRRRSYILTDKGREMLEKECARLTAQLADYHMIFGKEEI